MHVCVYFLSWHFILTPIYRSNLTSVVIWNIWQLSWFISYKVYPFTSFTNHLLKTVFILNYIFVFYHVVFIVHSPWLWSVTSTYFQIRANVFYFVLYRLEIKFSYSYSYFSKSWVILSNVSLLKTNMNGILIIILDDDTARAIYTTR